jgi:hypothetical protein
LALTESITYGMQERRPFVWYYRQIVKNPPIPVFLGRPCGRIGLDFQGFRAYLRSSHVTSTLKT